MTDNLNRQSPDINQRQAANPKVSAWVSASAGSGKTKVLSDRVLNLLLAGTAPEKILCLTFTKAAAAQMANRIAGRLSKWSAMPEEELKLELMKLTDNKIIAGEQLNKARRLFAEVLDAKGGMKIFTIHGFCQSILKRFPLEAGVSPNFKVMDEVDAKICMQDTINSAISACEIKKYLDLISLYVSEDVFFDMLKKLDENRGKINKAIKTIGSQEKLVAGIFKRLGLASSLSKESIIADIIANADEMKEVVLVLEKGGVQDNEKADFLKAFLAKSKEQRTVAYRSYLRVFLTKNNTIYASAVSKQAEAVRDTMEKEAARVFSLLQKLKNFTIAKVNEALLAVSVFILSEYEKTKRYRGQLDYSDLVLKTENLLKKQGGASWVLFKLDGGIDHILVDEAQDTSPEQWDIVRSLTEEFFAGESARGKTLRTVFAVGDKKQSIFSFQGADPDEFARNKDFFATKVKEAGQNFADVPLDTSFRSTPPVLALVDALLANSEIKRGVVAAKEKITHITFRDKEAGLVELWPVIEKEKSDEVMAWSPPVERFLKSSPEARLAGLIADKIAEMINNKEMLESKNRPVRAGDIMILLKKRKVIFAELVRALKARNIPVSGMDRMKIAEEIAIMDLMALGEFLLLPDDDLTLASLLKSPLLGLDEEALFDIAYKRGEKSLWEALKTKAEINSDYQKIVADLLLLLGMADKISPYNLYGFVLGKAGGKKKLIGRLGYDAEDAINEFMNLALEFEKNNIPSLQGFLAWVKAGDVEIKRDLEQDDINVVRITTVHSSKGLEAPIVFVANSCSGRKPKESIVWIKDDSQVQIPLWLPKAEMVSDDVAEVKEFALDLLEQEKHRLLYVALTRPRDRLYICAWGTLSPKSWYAAVENEIINNPELNAQSYERKGVGKIWYISNNDLTPRNITGKDEIKSDIEIPQWALTSPAAEPVPPKPLSPSKMEEDNTAQTSPLSLFRSKALQKGNIVHSLLALLPQVAVKEQQSFLAKALDKSKADLTKAEKDEIKMAVTNILTNADFAKLFSKTSKAEVPIIGMLEGKVFSGKIDRIAVTDSEVLLVDYKTNQNPPFSPDKVPEIYKRQIAIYKELLLNAFPNKKIKAFLLWTSNMNLMEIK